MIAALFFFLVGCLVLAVVIYVVKLILDMLKLPTPVYEIALLILGLAGLYWLLMLASDVFHTGRLPW